MESSVNPYEAPKAVEAALAVAQTEDRAELERIRRAHLNHEVSIQAIGLLHCLGAILVIAGSSFMVYDGLTRGAEPMLLPFAGLLLAIALFQGWVGLGLRNLRSSVKIPAGILAVLGLTAVPWGTLINGYVLYLLFSQKGTYIFSPAYQQVRAATPHIRYKTSIIVWIFLGLLLLVLLLAVVGVAVSTQRSTGVTVVENPY